MHTFKTHSKQYGFFDLGLSLIILALGGGASYIATEAHKEQVASNTQVESVELVYSQSSNDENQ